MNIQPKFAHKFIIFVYSLFLSACMMNASIEPLVNNSSTDGSIKILKKIYLDNTQITMSEGSVAIINIALDEKYSSDIIVNVDFNDPDNRFQPIAHSITIPAQSISKPIILQSIDDSIYQGTQTISLNISSQDTTIVADPNKLEITLTDNDAPPTITVTDASANESASTIKFSVSLNRQSILPTTFTYSTVNGSATAGSDYTAASNSQLTIPAGQTTGEISINLINDSTSEANETFTLALTNPTNASLQNSTATGTIIEDDVYISINDVTVSENAGTATFTISLDKASALDVPVTWATANGTAIAGTNYTSSSASITIPAGTTTMTISVPIIDTPGICEGTRQFYVNLSSATNATIQDTQGVGSITENDYPSISLGNTTIGEAYIASAPISLSQTCNVNISVNYSTADNTATAGLDYLGATNLTATIPAGSLSAYIPVLIFNDSTSEPNETFTVTISSPNYGSISTATGTVTIQNDDYTRIVPTNFTHISAGGYHNCAVNSSGEIKCWGRNNSGQLGSGAISIFEEIPVTVSGLGGLATKVSAGGTQGIPGFTCAIIGGGVKCWGRNDYGQLGDGTLINSSTPVDVTGLTSNVTSISLGEYSACALINDGTIKCWGRNHFGQLGNNTTTDSSVPVSVSGIVSGATSVSIAYAHACAVVSGNGYCWGVNGYGQLGNGTYTQSLVPVAVTGLSNAANIIVAGDDMTGYQTSCSLQTNGTIYCWGFNGSLFGTASTGLSNTKILNPNFASGVSSISMSPANICAVVSGVVKCWGSDIYANFARPGHRYNIKPMDAALPLTVSQISIGGYRSSCAVVNGGAKCWGNNDNGQLGNSTYTRSSTPVDVTGLTSGISKVIMSGQPGDGNSHACAMTNSGALYCWGSNSHGQLGDGTTTTRNTPYQVFSTGVIDFDLSYGNSTCAIMTGGALKCWGRNDYGQLGDGTTTQATTPVNALGLSSGVTQVTASRTHTCVVVNGGLKCWGSNVKGELGQGSTGATQLTPIDVPGLTSGVTFVSATGLINNEATCAVVNGAAKCWGYGYGGHLGDGSGSDKFSPTQVSGLTSGVSKIKMNAQTTCALMTDGSLKCWGYNTYGDVGSGNLNGFNTPNSVPGFSSGVVDFDLGYYSTCVLTIGNGVKCFGNNYEGILGVGYSTESEIPIDIKFLPPFG